MAAWARLSSTISAATRSPRSRRPIPNGWCPSATRPTRWPEPRMTWQATRPSWPMPPPPMPSRSRDSRPDRAWSNSTAATADQAQVRPTRIRGPEPGLTTAATTPGTMTAIRIARHRTIRRSLGISLPLRQSLTRTRPRLPMTRVSSCPKTRASTARSPRGMRMATRSASRSGRALKTACWFCSRRASSPTRRIRISTGRTVSPTPYPMDRAP